MVVLDVGLGTHDAHVPFAVCCVQNLLHSKMMHKVNHRVALVLFGTNNTSNEPHAESAAQGDSSQYVDITTMVPMGYPDGETLRHLHTGKSYIPQNIMNHDFTYFRCRQH